MEDGSAFGGRPVCMHVLSEINYYPTFYSRVCVYVQPHESGVCNIKINVFLAEHRKSEENGF